MPRIVVLDGIRVTVEDHNQIINGGSLNITVTLALLQPY